MKIVLKDKILEEFNHNQEKLKNTLTFVGSEICKFRKYNEAKVKIDSLEKDIFALERTVAIISPNEDINANILQIEDLIKEKKRALEVEIQRVKLLVDIDDYDYLKKELNEDVKELKNMLRVWGYFIKGDELSGEQLLAYDCAKGKTEI